MTDFIISWVDSSDISWQKSKKEYTSAINDGQNEARFRDLGTLKYVFRSIEKNANWFDTIHFVTEGHLPNWLNVSHPRLKIHTHKDVFKNKSYLPTFNSSAIELNFNNIPNLSEQFVIFNDDTLILKSVQESDFFTDGIPKDFLIQNPLKKILQILLHQNSTFVHTVFNDVKVINNEFKQKDLIRNYPDKLFNQEYGFMGNSLNIFACLFGKYHFFEHYHHPQPHLKSCWEQVFSKYNDTIQKTCSSKFRNHSNVNQYLFRYWNLASGRFIPSYKQNFATVNLNSIKKAEDTKKLIQSKTFLCINDVPELDEKYYNLVKTRILCLLDSVLGTPSSFEN